MCAVFPISEYLTFFFSLSLSTQYEKFTGERSGYFFDNHSVFTRKAKILPFSKNNIISSK